jgi:hypothetical protein
MQFLSNKIFRDYTNLVLPTYSFLSYDSIHHPLLGCSQSNSLSNLTQKEYQINFDVNLEKQNVKYQYLINEIQFDDSELNDIGVE